MEMLRFIFHILRVLVGCVLISQFRSHSVAAAPVISSEIQATMYLQKYGYMNESSSAFVISKESVSIAIKDFQRFAGLAETGSLDSKTLNLMSMARCGVPDMIGRSGESQRFGLQGSKWPVTDLTYRISKYPRSLTNRRKVDRAIAKAFKVWSDVTNLNFIPMENFRVHIDIRFEEGEHGDRDNFDGPGSSLAHANFPQYGGDVHFDDEERWTINHNTGTNLFQVAVHQFGHSLGLTHSKVEASVMSPFYKGYQPTFTLDEDDILGIQVLYGQTRKETTPRPTPDLGRVPNLCQDSAIDAATKTEDGRTYLFKGDYYWQYLEKDIADGYPRKISYDWSGLPGNLDAALTLNTGMTYFFKKGQYWRFRNKEMESGYPRDISVGFEGIPDNIDAAFVWNGNGKTYFFKGDNYWRFDKESAPPVSSDYPSPISNWVGLPNNIDAVLPWTGQKTYFFKGKVNYRYNDKTEVVDDDDPPFPRSTSVWWFNC